MKKGRVNILEDGISKVIIQLAIPMIYGFLSVIGVSLVDAYFIGKLGTVQLAAFGFIFPVIFILNGLIIGIGNGSSAIVARAYGAGDLEKARRYTTDALILGMVVISVLSIIGLFTIEPIFRLIGAKDDTIPFIKEYMHIWYFGCVFVVFPMIGNAAFTAIGDTRTSSRMMVMVLLCNSIFDPIMIFGLWFIPALGFKGAAVAVVCSRIFVLFASAYILIKRDKIVSLKFPGFKAILESWKKILYIGLPSAATNIIVPTGFAIIIHIASKFGKEAVAAISVAERVEALSVTVLLAIAVAMSPFVGQNLGAKNFGRIKTGMRKAFQFSIYWGLLLAAVLFTCSGLIIQGFSKDPIVIQYFKDYFYIVPFSYGVMGIMFCAGTALNVFNKPFHSSLVTLTRVFFAYVPLSIIFTYFFGVWGIFISAFLANIIAGIIAMTVYRKQSKKVFNSLTVHI
jgi:putative MATE family efflux protein